MNPDVERVLLVLAGSGVPSSSIRRFLRWALTVHPDAVAYALKELRAEARGLVSELERSKSVERRYQTEVTFRNRDLPSKLEDAALSIQNLLLRDAGLTASDASGLLLDSLSRKQNISKSELPRFNKEKFTRWLEKLSRHASYSELLHEATRIRNSLVHTNEKSSDWPLRSDGKRKE